MNAAGLRGTSGDARVQAENQRTEIAAVVPAEPRSVPVLVVGEMRRGDSRRDPVPKKPTAAAKPLQFDIASDFGLSGAAAPARPRFAETAGYGARPTEAKLDLGAPLRLFAFAILLMVGDFGYSAVTGEAFHVGPARIFWVAGPIAALGAVQLLSRLLAHGD